MCDVSKVLDFILFADDTNIFFSHKNVNEELPNLTDWCQQANKLSINEKKTTLLYLNPGKKGKH